MQIGPYRLDNNLILAPMAGVTDLPFRQLCRRLGAGMAVSEMVASNPAVWDTEKSRLRIVHADESEPRSVQIAGSDPALMADAARYNVAQGAQIIDINMGCPAKKVYRKEAGSALMANPALVERILAAVVDAVKVPVTLKMRTGINPESRNAIELARIAEANGIAAVAVHGRTRVDAYRGEAEYETIRAVKQSVSIPVIANGDIDSPAKAVSVLKQTGADALMIGRAAQGNPWIFGAIAHFLASGEQAPPVPISEVARVMLDHLDRLHRFYGEGKGVRIARKHIGWYIDGHPGATVFRREIMQVTTAVEQRERVAAYFAELAAATNAPAA